MRSKLLIYYAILLLPAASLSQTIEGNIKDSANQPIADVNVIYSDLNAKTIAEFSISDTNGHFRLTIQPKYDSVKISFSRIGYVKQTIYIKNVISVHNIILSATSTKLKDIIVRSNPIYQEKDTLNYQVSAFANQSDRTIGDVIKKLPGIEMRGNEILYNGKPLMKYYINGLDMLGGEYSLANNNLPFDAVKKVQIIENDQPVKILDSLVFSNKASLNIQLKKFTTTGSGTLGLGAPPFLWDVNLTPMTFDKSFQMLNSIQCNNIGDDVSKQLTNYTSNDMSFYLENTTTNQEKNFTGITRGSNPPFDEQRWLNNNIKLFNSNILQQFKSGFQLTGNLSYYNDFQKKSVNTNTTIYTPAQNVTVTDNANTNFNTNFLQARFNITKNEKNLYLIDKLDIQGKWENNKGNNLRNENTNLLQQAHNQNTVLDNFFGTTFFIGKQLISASSNTSYNTQPQNLNVTPGQFAAILNDSIDYALVSQKVMYKDFNSDNNISLIKTWGKIVINTKAGVSYQKQNLNSYLSSTNKTFDSSKEAMTNNDLSLSFTKLYLHPSFYFKNYKWQIYFDFPLRFQKISSGNFLDSTNSFQPASTFFPEPDLTIDCNISGLWRIELSSNYKNTFGDISNLYGSYILSNYNSLQRNFSAEISKTKAWNNSIAFSFKNPVKSTFSNISFEYNKTFNNFLYENIIDSVGSVLLKAVSLNNNSSIKSVSADYSKLFTQQKTILKLNGSATFTSTPILFNPSTVSQKSEQYNSSIEINNDAIKNTELQLTSSFSFIYSSLNTKSLKNIRQQTQRLIITILPFKQHMITTTLEYYANNLNTGNRLFLNLKYDYSLVKQKIDLELKCNNVLSSHSFSTVYTDSYSIIRSQFYLRPRQFLVLVKFNFK